MTDTCNFMTKGTLSCHKSLMHKTRHEIELWRHEIVAPRHEIPKQFHDGKVRISCHREGQLSGCNVASHRVGMSPSSSPLFVLHVHRVVNGGVMQTQVHDCRRKTCACILRGTKSSRQKFCAELRILRRILRRTRIFAEFWDLYYLFP